MLRLFVKVLLTLFSLILMSCFLLQVPLIKKQLKELIESELSNRGIELTIGSIGGSLPFEWVLKEVSYTPYTAHGEHSSLFFEGSTIKGRISLLSLFKKKVKISHLKAQGTFLFPYQDPFSEDQEEIRSYNFKASAVAELSLDKNKEILISTLLVEGEGLYARLQGKFLPKSSDNPLEIQEGNLSFYAMDLHRFSPIFSTKNTKPSSLAGSLQLSADKAHMECFSEGVSLWGAPVESSVFLIDGTKEGTDVWKANASFKGGFTEIPLEGDCSFQCDIEKKLLTYSSIKLKGEQLRLFGEGSSSFDLQSMQGHFFGQCTDLRTLRPLFPQSYLAGNVGVKLDIEMNCGQCNLDSQLQADHLSMFSFSGQNVSMEAKIEDLWNHRQGEVSIEGRQLCLQELVLSKGLFHATINDPLSSFELWLEGQYKDPLELSLKGSFGKHGELFSTVVHELRGFGLKKPFSLTRPCLALWSPTSCKVEDLSLKIARGSLQGNLSLNPVSSLVHLEGVEVPLAVLSPLTKTLFVEGSTSFNIELSSSKKEKLQGTILASLEKGLIYPEGANDPLFAPLPAKGSLQMHFNENRGQLHLDLKAEGGQMIQCMSSFAFDYTPFPFSFQFEKSAPFSMEWVAEGKLEELFRFVNPGIHHMEGWLSTRGLISHTLCNPKIWTEVEIQDGIYENQLTGTYLQHLSMQASMDPGKQKLEITHFSGKDRSEGTMEGVGSVLLSTTEGFPFQLDTVLSHFTTISCSLGVGKFSGPLNFLGTTTFTKAQGTLKAEQVTLRIPEHLPTIFPDLAIKFINPPQIMKRKKESQASITPLALDLIIEAPDHIFIEERGLSCELAGSIHLKGTYSDVIASGRLHLVQGKYVLGGKAFTITEGELIFTEKPQASAYISLSGTCELADVSVFVALRGPLTNPKLTFHSNPSLPTSAILSLILFNKDVSEISAVQAIELAQTLLSFSGVSAPDLLGKIRKTLGVDRLSLLSSESDPSQLSVQIGKYLMKGVLLTFSQGTNDRNIGVEIDLTKGFTFQAENTLDRKQKFSLTWRHHY